MRNQKILPITILFLAVLTVMPLVLAGPYIITPISGENFSKTMYINISFANGTDISKPTDAICYSNATGSWTSLGGTFAIIEKASTNSSASATITLTSSQDAIGASVNCSITNSSASNNSDTIIIGFDSTSPSVTTSIEQTSVQSGRTFEYSTSISDATLGVQAQSCNITDPEGTVYTASIGASKVLFETDRLTDDGTWTLLCAASDYEGNSQTSTTTIDTYTGRATTSSTASSSGGTFAMEGGLSGLLGDSKTVIIVIILIAGVLWLLNKKR